MEVHHFALLGNRETGSRPLLYVCHEGQAGVIAASFAEAIRLMIAAPYWRDLLKFSGSGDLANMLRAEPLLERELTEDEPQIEAVRAELESLMGVERLQNPVHVLHQNVIAFQASLRVISTDGEVFDSLFNSFVPEDNPAWRAQ